jgi:hypothetical protein
MVGKRAPGAGRKPRGEFRGKTATLTTRITPKTRAALERASRNSGRSLSQEVESRLDASLRGDRNRARGSHIRALGEAVMLVAQCIERATEKNWTEDAFTGGAIRDGIEFLISHFAGRGTQVVPPSIEGATARMPHEVAEYYNGATGVGLTETGRVISWIESWNYRDLDECVQLTRAIPGTHIPDEWYAHEQLFRSLGSGCKRAQAREKGR